VELGPRSYEVHVEAGCLPRLGEAAKRAVRAHKIAIITDDVVGPLYAAAVECALREAAFETAVLSFPAGEAFKNIATVNTLWEGCLQFGMDRSSAVAALGGGVVGDVAGFVAATLLRGVDLVQVPTTLLADVDSSVGGKTGIDHPLGKNLIGAFHQPRLVWIDPQALRTLDPRDVRSGIAEVIKYAIIRDPYLFEYLAVNRDAVVALDADAMEQIIGTSCQIKAEIVAADETEAGQRRILNYGHTIGHAIEALDYGRLRHGEAVSMGMVAAAQIACNMGLCDAELPRRQAELLAAYGLPVSLPGIDADAVIARMAHDKKAHGGKPRFVLPVAIGQVAVVEVVDEALVREAIKALM